MGRIQTQVLDGDGPGALAHEGDVVRVPAESGDVGPDPAKGSQLIIQAEVAVPAVLVLYPLMGEISQGPHPVVGHDRHGPPPGPAAAVEGVLGIEAGVEAAAVEEQDHGSALGLVGGVDVQVQAVLAVGELAALPVLLLIEQPYRVLQMLVDGPILGAAGAEGCGVQHPVPSRHRLRVLEPPGPPEGHPPEFQARSVIQPPYLAQGRAPCDFFDERLHSSPFILINLSFDLSNPATCAVDLTPYGSAAR